MPATQAVMKQAKEPAKNALGMIVANSFRRSGAMLDSVANWIPTEDGLENPHNAYVAMDLDLICYISNRMNIKTLILSTCVIRNFPLSPNVHKPKLHWQKFLSQEAYQYVLNPIKIKST